ncbi:hypothetical protein GCM10012280_70200 [Wenjunlia tyrosinilytica]|uniref:Bacterial transcriptional activator domain-containing protein n=1 Tax=Wenjunlia tyrosinilytica TaxID=1544741 RepID=A0A918A1B0_9ACTN|nr:hypothetical protein GCM10012280_70200 [Wenjunlia tyrosinilytica]
MQLFCGPPLADVASAWADRVREALSREWPAARTAAAAAWLRAGQHVALVPDLMDLAEERSLDETITGPLMVALHRGGQHAEALERCAALRNQLIEQVGDEPGPPLRDLHACLLRRDTADT